MPSRSRNVITQDDDHLKMVRVEPDPNDLQSLASGQHLSERAVAFGLRMVGEHVPVGASGAKTFFFEPVVNPEQRANVAFSPTKLEGVDWSAYRGLVLPICSGKHWFLALGARRFKTAPFSIAFADSQHDGVDHNGQTYDRSQVHTAYWVAVKRSLAKLGISTKRRSDPQLPLHHTVDNSGAYLLGYARSFVEDPTAFALAVIHDLQTLSWNPSNDHVRQALRQDIQVWLQEHPHQDAMHQAAVRQAAVHRAAMHRAAMNRAALYQAAMHQAAMHQAHSVQGPSQHQAHPQLASPESSALMGQAMPGTGHPSAGVSFEAAAQNVQAHTLPEFEFSAPLPAALPNLTGVDFSAPSITLPDWSNFRVPAPLPVQAATPEAPSVLPAASNPFAGVNFAAVVQPAQIITQPTSVPAGPVQATVPPPAPSVSPAPPNPSAFYDFFAAVQAVPPELTRAPAAAGAETAIVPEASDPFAGVDFAAETAIVPDASDPIAGVDFSAETAIVPDASDPFTGVDFAAAVQAVTPPTPSRAVGVAEMADTTILPAAQQQDLPADLVRNSF